jgi:5-methylcytosine-specific restriction protein B
MDPLIELIHMRLDGHWGERARAALEGFARDRYGKAGERRLQVRANGAEDGAPYAALIPYGQPRMGAYGGMSFVLFPSKDAPALVSLVIGTNGLAPDEQALGRPGHARKVRAIAAWLSATRAVAWRGPSAIRCAPISPCPAESRRSSTRMTRRRPSTAR